MPRPDSIDQITAPPKPIPEPRAKVNATAGKTMHREKLSYRETARQFDICDHDRVAAWERIYLEEGAEGLYI